MNKLVVVGSINADVVIHTQRHPQPGETLVGSGGQVSAGGKGANQAVAAARLGADVSFVGAVGSDAYAEPAMAHMDCVDTTAVEVVDTNTGLALITVDAAGENTIVLSPGANALVDAPFVTNQSALVDSADMVLLQGEIPAEGFAAAVDAARGRVVVNLAPVIAVDKDALLKADPLIANEHEAGLILAQFGGPTEGSPRELAQGLHDAGFNSVVLTLGSAGALVAEDEFVEIPTPSVDVVDTTGAGDAFAGALCARLLQGDTLIDAAFYAARVGAFAVTSNGAQASYPNLKSELPG